jgi:N-acyl-D-aspartate/D-glutamate deacylase
MNVLAGDRARGSFVLRGGTVVDGSGAPPQRADVAVASGRIVKVGRVGRSDVATDIDVSGLVVTPGFIDIHTHYDAQVLWDPALRSSTGHGVTTVVTGNCGFTLAPTRVDDRSSIIDLLRVVEGMSAAVLQAGVAWTFETFHQYVSVVRRQPIVPNIGMLVGHDAIRRYAMGPAAIERAATPAERARMAEMVAEAVRAAAFGFSTDRSGAHIDASGRPVPSMVADDDEVRDLCGAAAAARATLVEVAAGREFGIDEHVSLALASGLSVTPTALLSGLYPSDEIESILERAARANGKVLPQVSPRPRLHYLTLAVPHEWIRMSESFGDALELDPVALALLYSDPAWRERARGGLTPRGDKLLATATVAESTRHTTLVGRALASIATERTSMPFDTLLDLALEDGLETRFVYSMYNDDERGVAALMRDRRTILGLSDAGAHCDRVYDANFPTYLLARWVRELAVLPLEFAVWRLTGQIAEFLRLTDRGFVQPGQAADLVAFDADRVAPGRAYRVFDLPAGGDRLVSDSVGVHHIWVNGVPVRLDGRDTVAHPGVVLRSRGGVIAGAP